RGAGPVEYQGLVAAQVAPIRVTHRCDHAESVETAAQNDDQKARITPLGTRNLRQVGPSEQNARTEEQGAPREGKEVRHDHLRRNSGAIKSSASACGLLSARIMASRVSAEASGPIAVSAMACGSSCSATRRAKALAM